MLTIAPSDRTETPPVVSKGTKVSSAHSLTMKNKTKKIFASSIVHQARRTGWLALLGATSVGVTCAVAAPWRMRLPAASLVNRFAAEPVATDALRPNEQEFLTKAIEAVGQQMRLAAVGASKADSAEVRSQALQLTAEGRQMADTLDALVRRKGGIPGAPVGGTSEGYQKLAEKAGVEFDREFVLTASQLIANALMLFEKGAADSRDPDVRELAAAQLPVLRGQHNTLSDLKKKLD